MATTIWSRNKLYVDVSINEDGNLVFAGQDLDPPGAFGAEYEYWITVAADDIPVVVAALGGTLGDDIIPLVAANAEIIVRTGERAWLAGLGLTTEFASYS